MGVYFKAKCAESPKCLQKPFLCFLQTFSMDNQVINEHQDLLHVEVTHALVHEPLKCKWAVHKSLAHFLETEQPKGTREGSNVLGGLFHGDVKIALFNIHRYLV